MYKVYVYVRVCAESSKRVTSKRVTAMWNSLDPMHGRPGEKPQAGAPRTRPDMFPVLPSQKMLNKRGIQLVQVMC